jgi:hypothetical protein
MTYRVLCDENVPKRTVEHIDEFGIDVVHVSDRPGAGSTDVRVARFALERDRLLLTNDDDFLDEAAYPDVTVLYYPDNSVDSYELAERVEEVTSLVSEPNDLGRITFLTE